MYIKSMILEGFKSYGRRIEVNGFDKEFNAITGFNGSGKSNVLDAICFVLGISNLGQVRATSLQDLVYKSGQAGIRKASVTITFDNRDKKSSPIGYEHQQEITVTRQVEIGGKNKYMINGTTVQNKRVQDMFCSVQLNVNNPHFLIMQGRITKVLNMKPIEILSMVEEAAGTRMYETKKQSSLKLIAKKDSKLKEIKDILTEEIGPKLAKLREERVQFVEYQYIERELEQYHRMFIAWNYVTVADKCNKAEQEASDINKKIEAINDNITATAEELVAIEEKLEELYKKRDGEQGKQLESLSKELQEAEKKHSKLLAENNSKKEHIKTMAKAIEQLKTNISDDESTLNQKINEFDKVEGIFQELKDVEKNDAEALQVAQEKFQKISAGLLESNDGENATLENQLMNAKQVVTEAQTELKQCQMTLQHSKQQLKVKQEELHCTEGENKEDKKNLQEKEKELKNIQNELHELNYKDGYVEGLKNQKHTLHSEIKELQNQIDQFESKYPQTRFNYRDPERNFNRNSVKGMVCNLFKVKDKKSAYALEVVAGGKLYNVVVDTETTSKKVLQNGQLKQRVTIIPLNRVRGNTINNETVQLAKSLVGADNVQTALSHMNFSEEMRPAMEWIFGQIFICKNMEVAKKIAYHKNIMKKCVTLDGDVFDPTGTLSGGAQTKGGSILLKLDEIAEVRARLLEKRNSLTEIEKSLANADKMVEKYTSLKQVYDLRNYEIDLIKQRLAQTTHHKIKEEIQNLEAEIAATTEKIAALKKEENANAKRVETLEAQLQNVVKIREKQLKEAENQLTLLRKKAEASRSKWRKREQEAGTLELEMKELRKTIDSSKEQLAKHENENAVLKENEKKLQDELKEIKDNVNSLQATVKELKDIANRENRQIQTLNAKKEGIFRQNQDAELEIKKLNHVLSDTSAQVVEHKKKISALTEKHTWIEQDKKFFGKSGGIYDFDAHNPEETKKKMQHLEASREKLSRKINMRAISLLDKEEEQFNDMMKKKKIVENDRRKILETIRHLDEKKEQTLYMAWEQVNKDFGSIFSTLLPGACAKLTPPENQKVTDGLEVKIGFSGVWKESLTELSGGQRSLVALSLILAMLLFKPAPVYILDEVDAALDLSHTENIGLMLKRHFTHSQFIVVSLKDGMFNNANVLYTTKFVDGMSTIHRSERSKSK